jgi:hypothetical protein
MSGPTTTTTTMGVLLERSEVDKSLKSLEAVIAVFYDYCQLSASIAATSRKLARALKDTAVIKATSQYPGIIILIIPAPLIRNHSANVPLASTLSAAALIFDAAGEVDLKFSKTVEREYEASMNELKKWVKKLKVRRVLSACSARLTLASLSNRKKTSRLMNTQWLQMQR